MEVDETAVAMASDGGEKTYWEVKQQSSKEDGLQQDQARRPDALKRRRKTHQ